MKVEIKPGLEVYYDRWLHDQYAVIRDKIIMQDWDWVTFVDGVEGGGKSTLAQQLAVLCDPNFNLSKICFTHQEFIKSVMEAKKYEAIIFDEAYGSLASKQAISQVCKTLESLLAQVRQKNLFLFVVAPTYFDISRNIALWRSRCLIHVYVGQNYQRGYWRAFTFKKKNLLYLKGRDLYNYSAVAHSALGRFTKKKVVDSEQYQQKKLDALSHFQEQNDSISKVHQQRNALITHLLDNNLLSNKQISKLLAEHNAPLSVRSINHIKQQATGNTITNT